MKPWEKFRKVPTAPTNPDSARHKAAAHKPFDVANLFAGPLDEPEAAAAGQSLDEKMRQAYFWIVNTAIISPFYDIEYNGDAAAKTFRFGDSHTTLRLPSAQSYSSFVLLPLLNMAVRRRCLLVGGPGRGKTASAVLMGLLAGYSSKDLQRAIQHGQPQMTIADLLGNPMPADLMAAKTMDDIRISWRKWLSMRVKIIDEYNRIPTRTQSALLTVMADEYAELYDQVYECPSAAWYLTANDDSGGGTYPVIEALRDRIDIVVRALHFNTRFIGDLLDRIEADIQPESLLPESIIFSQQELDTVQQQIRQIQIPQPLLRRLEFFAGQFEFAEYAAAQLEYQTKDTIKLADLAGDFSSRQETGKDRLLELGHQTGNGLSVRAIMTLLTFVKAAAWFRGNDEVELEDLRQVLPFVLHDKLTPDHDAAFFEQPEHNVFRADRIGWLRRLFDLACDEFDRLGRDHDPINDIAGEFEQGLEGLGAKHVKKRMEHIERMLKRIAKGNKLYAYLFDDVLKLKYYHQRYQNYLHWLDYQA